MPVLFLKLLNMSIAASWLILAVIVLRPVLRKAPRYILCILWGLVGIRLISPWSWESIMSLIPSAETVSPDILYQNTPTIHSGISLLNQSVNPVLSQTLAPAGHSSLTPIHHLTVLASGIWIAGAVVMLVSGMASYILLHRRVADAVHLRDNLWQSEKAPSPFILGLWRPRIILPYALAETNIAPVVLHEQAHIDRRDHWFKLAGYLFLSAYWFNPLVWLSYHLLSRDIELACDERAVKDLGPREKRAYSEALLACSMTSVQIAACPLAFGEISVRHRIKNVLQNKRPAFWLIMIALLSCIVLAACFLTDPLDTSGMNQPTSDGSTTRAVSSTNAALQAPEWPDGIYAFDSCIYMSPISSYLPYLDTGCLYVFSEDRFQIVSSSSGEILDQCTGISGAFTPLPDQVWADFFREGMPGPDITDINHCYMLEMSDRYRLLNMDGAWWLLQAGDEKAWSIYKLVPQAENNLTLAKLLILAQYREHLAWEHFRPYAASDIGSGRYIYAFPIDQNWRLIINSGSGFTYGAKIPDADWIELEYLPDNGAVNIREDPVAEFIALKESARTGIPVVCSGYSLSQMAPEGSLSDQNVIYYDDRHAEMYGLTVPFSVYVDGREVNGGYYTITDLETGQPVEFFHPSGLSSQTYILHNTEPGRKYRITFQYHFTDKEEALTYSFIICR